MIVPRFWGQGAGLLSYLGHGSVGLWSEVGLLASEDADALGNGERLPIVLAFTWPRRRSRASGPERISGTSSARPRRPRLTPMSGTPGFSSGTRVCR